MLLTLSNFVLTTTYVVLFPLFALTKDNDAVRELKKFLLDNCKESGSKETREEFTEVMEGQHAIGFLINERFINIPPQIAVHFERIRNIAYE